MSYTLELLYDLLLKPRQTFENIRETAELTHAAVILLLCNILNALALFSANYAVSIKIMFLVMIIIYTLLNWTITVGVMHGMAHLVGGQGSYKQMLKLSGFISFITLFMVPCYMLDLFMPTLAAIFFCIVGIGLFFWSIWLNILALSVNYNLSMLRAFFAYILPLLILIGILAIIIIGLISVQSEVFDYLGDFENQWENAVQI